MSLGVVIPVRNDQVLLTRLLKQIRDLDIANQTVVVDDGSDTPVSLETGLYVDLVRNPVPRGPGVARNLGLDRITTDHVLFFDSDDLMTSEMVPLYNDLRTCAFDFCLFRHCDSRQSAQGNWGLMPYDSVLWQAAQVSGHSLTEMNDDAAAHLVQTANFPWNKIWRTGFLRDNNIVFPDIPLHEDVLHHWMGFLKAKERFVSDRVAAVHFVSETASRMTNSRDLQRLKVFDSFRQILIELDAAGSNRLILRSAFFQFAADLLDWIRGQLSPADQEEMAECRRAFWQEALSPSDFEVLAHQAPTTALHLTLQMMRETARC